MPSEHLSIPFVQEVVAVATSLKDFAPQTDVNAKCMIRMSFYGHNKPPSVRKIHAIILSD